MFSRGVRKFFNNFGAPTHSTLIDIESTAPRLSSRLALEETIISRKHLLMLSCCLLMLMTTPVCSQTRFTRWTNEHPIKTSQQNLSPANSTPIYKDKLRFKVVPFDNGIKTGKGAPLFILEPEGLSLLVADEWISFGDKVESEHMASINGTTYYEVRYRGENYYISGYYLEPL